MTSLPRLKWGVVRPRLRTAALVSLVRALHQLPLTERPGPDPAEEQGDA